MASSHPAEFHAQLGERVHTSEALRIASSLFYDGIERFDASQHEAALLCFEQALAINQKYLSPASSGCILCCNNIAAVHDRMGNLPQAALYYERARQGLCAENVPRDERSVVSRRRRQELLRHVQSKLDKIPRSNAPKIGAGVDAASLRQLIRSAWDDAQASLLSCEWSSALQALEYVLMLAKRVDSSGVQGLRSVGETLGQMGYVHFRLGNLNEASSHVKAAIELLEALPDAADDSEYSSPSAGVSIGTRIRQLHDLLDEITPPVVGLSTLADSSTASGASSTVNGDETRHARTASEITPDSKRHSRNGVDSASSQAPLVGPHTPAHTPAHAHAQAPLSSCADGGSSSSLSRLSNHQCCPVERIESESSRESSKLCSVYLPESPALRAGEATATVAATDAVAAMAAAAVAATETAAVTAAAANAQVTQHCAVSGWTGSGGHSCDGARTPLSSDLATASRHAVAAMGAAAAARTAAHEMEAAAMSRCSSQSTSLSAYHGNDERAVGAGGAAATEEDEFAWRAGQEEDDEEAGPLDDRIEGAINELNTARDLMTEEQIALDVAKRKLQTAERNTQLELDRLRQREHAVHLQKLNAYEQHKQQVAEMRQEESKGALSMDQRIRLDQMRAESLQMALQMQEVFNALIPYFTCVSLLEQELEEARQRVTKQQQKSRAARRAYHDAMERLEALSLEIQQKQQADDAAAAASSAEVASQEAAQTSLSGEAMHDHLQHGNGACEDHSAAAVGGEGGEGGGSGAVPTEALAACAISSDESSACVAGASVDDAKISEREGDGVVGVKEAGVEADGVREERGVWEVKGEGNGVREGAEGEDQGEREVAGVRVAETEEVKLNRGNGVADLTKPELDGIGNGAYEIAPEVRRPNGAADPGEA